VTLSEILDLATPLIAAHSADDAPTEACGVVLADGSIHRLINQARSSHRWAVSKVQMRELMELHKSPIAIYHSHPTSLAIPSSPDKTMMEAWYAHAGLSLPFLIYGIDGLRAWTWDTDHATEMRPDVESSHV
jgi:proteasome lid subunit RPN8/RPN11